MKTPESFESGNQEELLAGPPQPGTVGFLVQLIRELADPKNPRGGIKFDFAGMKTENYPISNKSQVAVYFFPKEANDDTAPKKAYIAEIDVGTDRVDSQLSRRFLVSRNGEMKKFERTISRANFIDETTGLEFMPDEEKEMETNEREVRGLVKLLESFTKDKNPPA